MKNSRAEPATALSLFSGGGGLDIGVEQAGFNTLACIEQDANCCETLRSNQPQFFKDAKIIQGDVSSIDIEGLIVDCRLELTRGCH